MTNELDNSQPCIKIGQLVKANIPAILAYCEQNPEEFGRLQQQPFAKAEFGIAWPFLTVVSDIAEKDSVRYWAPVYSVLGAQVRVTSQWFEKHRDAFLAFLQARGIASAEEACVVASEQVQVKTNQLQAGAVSKARFRGAPVGNAQNYFVRTLLSNLGSESFTAEDWARVTEEFGNACAYCRTPFDAGSPQRKRVMDHAVPINRVSLGEHRLGNLVPACHACNQTKGQKGYAEFCADEASLARIEAHMDRYGYVPIGEDEQVALFVETAYKEVRELSQRYLLLINALRPDGTAPEASMSEAPEPEREEAARLTRDEPLTEAEIETHNVWDREE